MFISVLQHEQPTYGRQSRERQDSVPKHHLTQLGSPASSVQEHAASEKAVSYALLYINRGPFYQKFKKKKKRQLNSESCGAAVKLRKSFSHSSVNVPSN